MLYNRLSEAIGNTPLVRLSKIEKEFNLEAKLYGKLEYFNPGSSVKDRIALAMIEDAEKRGLLKPDSVIIEPTSGNTGIGLAMVGAMKGYNVVLVMPSTLSVERRKLMLAYGAKLVLTEGTLGMKGAIEEAKRLVEITENSFMPYQFENPANPTKHYVTTGPEIWNDLEGKVDVFVAGIGTGGTISGAGKYLKEQNPELWVVGVEPANSPILSKNTAGPHKIQGIGAGFVPNTLDRSILNEVAMVEDEVAFEYARLLPRYEGILAGISAGAAFKAAIDLAKKKTFKGKNIVFIVPDTGERYLSTNLFEER